MGSLGKIIIFLSSSAVERAKFTVPIEALSSFNSFLEGKRLLPNYVIGGLAALKLKTVFPTLLQRANVPCYFFLK